MDDQRSVEGLESRAAGTDPEDPYEDVDLGTLPEWWRRAVEEFEAHGLRPYRPPRFDDGGLVHETVEALEEEFGIEVGFVSHDPGGEWTVLVDGDPAGTVGRHRSTEGYTVYETDSEAFASLVREAVG